MMFGTEHLQCSRLHPCSNTDGCVFSCSQSHSPPGRHRCRGLHPCCPAARPPAFLGGRAPAPLASAWEESWLVGTPPEGNNQKQADSTVEHISTVLCPLQKCWFLHFTGEARQIIKDKSKKEMRQES